MELPRNVDLKDLQLTILYNTWLEQTVVGKSVLEEFTAMKASLQQLQKTVFHHFDELKRDMRTLG